MDNLTPAVEPDLQELVERLRRKVKVFPSVGGGAISVDGSFTSWTSDDGMRLANPDGPAAIEVIQSLSTALQQAERRGAERALEMAAKHFDAKGEWEEVAFPAIEYTDDDGETRFSPERRSLTRITFSGDQVAAAIRAIEIGDRGDSGEKL